MKRLLIEVVVITLLAGCASDPGARRETIVKEQTGRLPAPTTPLSSYKRFELKPMDMADSVAKDQSKTAVAKDLEARLQAVVQPMLTQWNAASGNRPAKTLIIQPRVTQLRVVHGATRAFAGAFAGDSSITMDLELRDAATGAVIAKPSIARSADALAGAWSFGATDRNLLDYITNIASEYLERHHGR
jgi:uncharacterized protein DUF4410